MLQKISDFIASQQLLSRDELHLVALSGGADSVALLLALTQLGYRAEAVHCNFHLRGEESNRDERFCRQLCERMAIAFHTIHFDTYTYAECHKVSIEMAARELRYRFFEQLRNDLQAADICVAHHQDDNVETILINLLRGTGIQGLTGMRPRHGYVVRPLLCVSRQEIVDWLASRQQDYVTDSTNMQADVVRNKIRLNVVPQLLQVTPQARENILLTARLLHESQLVADDALSNALQCLLSDDGADIAALLSEPSPESLLHRWLSPYGFTSATIMQMAQHVGKAQTGRCWSSDTHEVYVDRGRLELALKAPSFKPLTIPEPGLYVLSDGTRLSATLVDGTDIDRRPSVACLDAGKVRFPLCVRSAVQGDRIVPLGMKGSRLVSDLLTDQKMPLAKKKRQLVVTDGADCLVWVVGVRPADTCRIGPATSRVLRLELLADAQKL